MSKLKILDFHTHIYPDEVAKKAIARLAKGSLQPLTGCTAAEAAVCARQAGVTCSVCLPVATKPGQVAQINRFSAETNARYDNLCCFAGIFPGAADMEAQIRTAAALGLPGIKVHPQFQGVYLDDPCMVRLIGLATEYGMLVLFHGGIDIALPYPVYSSPQRTLHLLEQLQQAGITGYRLISAHMGGYALWDDVENYLIGSPLYFDTSFLAGRMPAEQMKRIILQHGTDKILFGTDFPWQSVEENRHYLLGLGLEQAQLQAIFYDNGAALLGMASGGATK